MSRRMGVSLATYEQVALEDTEGAWELVGCGQLRRKPETTMRHNSIQRRLCSMIARQTDEDEYEVAQNSTRGALPGVQRYVPDVCVVPVGLMAPLRASTRLEIYVDPLPFVAEVWSPSTGDYDVDSKFPGYRERGDAVIWRIHPHERTVTAWVRQADGSYAESVHRGGKVAISSLPGVVIDLDRLFR